MLGGGANEGDRAHHSNCVETGTCEDGGLHEHERGEDCRLTQVEAAPEGVFLNVAVVTVSLTFYSKASDRGLRLTYQGS